MNELCDAALADKDMMNQMNNILINKLEIICKKIDSLEHNKENINLTAKGENFFYYC